MKKNKRKSITPKSKADFRSWLSKNHKQKESVDVVLFKLSSKTKNLSWSDLVDECLCFGWIDSVPGKIDSEKYRILISPRKPKSVWSAINKKKVSSLIKQKLMTPAGLEKIKIAKENGSWSQLNLSDRLALPPELQTGLDKNKKAQKFFEAFSPSTKRAILEWIYAAKKSETKKARITKTINLASKGIRANFKEK